MSDKFVWRKSRGVHSDFDVVTIMKSLPDASPVNGALHVIPYGGIQAARASPLSAKIASHAIQQLPKDLDVCFALIAELRHYSQKVELIKSTPSNVERVLCIRHVALREAVPLLVSLKVSLRIVTRLRKILQWRWVVEYVLCGVLEDLLEIRLERVQPTSMAWRPACPSLAFSEACGYRFAEVLSHLVVCLSQAASEPLNRRRRSPTQRPCLFRQRCRAIPSEGGQGTHGIWRVEALK